jgi:hypothetical protein
MGGPSAAENRFSERHGLEFSGTSRCNTNMEWLYNNVERKNAIRVFGCNASGDKLMNKTRKDINILILTFVSFTLITSGCEPKKPVQATATPEITTIRVGVGEVVKFDEFNFSVSEVIYEIPNPKGALFITVLIENKTSAPLPYSAEDFSVTSSAGQQELLVLPREPGSTWSADFSPNSSILANNKDMLKLLAETNGDETNFLLALVLLQYKVEVELGR